MTGRWESGTCRQSYPQAFLWREQVLQPGDPSPSTKLRGSILFSFLYWGAPCVLYLGPFPGRVWANEWVCLPVCRRTLDGHRRKGGIKTWATKPWREKSHLKSLVPSLHGKYMGKKWKQWQIWLSRAPKCLQMVTAAMKLKTLSLWKKSYDKPRQSFTKQRYHFADKGPSSQSYGFFSSDVRM